MILLKKGVFCEKVAFFFFCNSYNNFAYNIIALHFFLTDYMQLEMRKHMWI